jgi:hypothetical protein
MREIMFFSAKKLGFTAKPGVLRNKTPFCRARSPRGFNWRALDLIFRGGMSKTGSSRSGSHHMRGEGGGERRRRSGFESLRKVLRFVGSQANTEAKGAGTWHSLTLTRATWADRRPSSVPRAGSVSCQSKLPRSNHDPSTSARGGAPPPQLPCADLPLAASSGRRRGASLPARGLADAERDRVAS